MSERFLESYIVNMRGDPTEQGVRMDWFGSLTRQEMAEKVRWYARRARLERWTRTRPMCYAIRYRDESRGVGINHFIWLEETP